LNTFVDPLDCGGKLNETTREDLVERVELGGRQWLWYKSFPITVGLIRGTAADPLGNLLMDEEALIGEVLPIAQAVKNSGGLVIAQVKTIRQHPAAPQHVRVPGIFIDKIVVAEGPDHDQTFGEVCNSGYWKPRRMGPVEKKTLGPVLCDQRRIIAARAYMEVPENAIANLGIGIPEGIAGIAAEKGTLETLILTVESGPIGGMPAGGLSFGASLRPDAIIDQPAQFDFYDGGGLDFAALGAAQIDGQGNVNVSRFGPKLAGVGGFVNITQTAKKVVFCGTFTASGLEVDIDGGRLMVIKEGSVRKFLTRLEQISFNARQAYASKQEVLYVTERAVFRLTREGLELTETAPGVDVDKDILELMDFKPVIKHIKSMPAECFTPAITEDSA
jgi:propionate CoA-transferase